MQKLTQIEFLNFKDDNTLILDARAASDATESIIANALNIPFGEYFLETFQNVVDNEQQIVVICDEKEAAKISRTLLGSGFQNLAGYVSIDVFSEEDKSIIIMIDADEFAMDFNYDEFYLIDVRKQENFEAEHIEWAENIPLDDLPLMAQELEAKMRIYVIGENAEQSFTAASILKRNGIEFVRAVAATYDEFRTIGFPMIKPKKNKEKSASDPQN